MDLYDGADMLSMWKHGLTTIFMALIILCHAGCVTRLLLATGRGRQVTESAMVERAKAFRELVDNLERLGFYKYTDSDLLEEAKAESRTVGLFEGSTERDYVIHLKDLTEGGVKTFIEEASPFLKREGIAVNEIEESFAAGGEYSITVDGRRYVMYSQGELELEPEEIQYLTARRAFALVNDWLEQAGSKERLYLLLANKKARARAVFLTPEMFEIISQSSLIEDEEKPKFIG